MINALFQIEVDSSEYVSNDALITARLIAQWDWKMRAGRELFIIDRSCYSFVSLILNSYD